VDYLKSYFLTSTNEKMAGLESRHIKKQRVLTIVRTLWGWRIHGRLKPIFTQTLVVNGFDDRKCGKVLGTSYSKI